MRIDYSRGSGAVYLLIGITFVILGMVAFIFSKSIRFTPQTTALEPTPTEASTPTPGDPTPTIEVKDFAPPMPMSQKTTIIIRHSDSSESKYLVPTNLVETYIKSLPAGDEIVSKSP
jgi:hypothetical protein